MMIAAMTLAELPECPPDGKTIKHSFALGL